MIGSLGKKSLIYLVLHGFQCPRQGSPRTTCFDDAALEALTTPGRRGGGRSSGIYLDALGGRAQRSLFGARPPCRSDCQYVSTYQGAWILYEDIHNWVDFRTPPEDYEALDNQQDRVVTAQPGNNRDNLDGGSHGFAEARGSVVGPGLAIGQPLAHLQDLSTT